MKSRMLITAILASVVAIGIATSGYSEECTFTVSPRVIHMYTDQKTAEVTVTPSQPECPFTSGSKYNWLNVSPIGGSGEAVLKVSAEATVEMYRVGSVVIAGQEVDVIQFGPALYW